MKLDHTIINLTPLSGYFSFALADRLGYSLNCAPQNPIAQKIFTGAKQKTSLGGPAKGFWKTCYHRSATDGFRRSPLRISLALEVELK
jgi:hypothetical protein